jgi:surfactin family lipopeptide synthetase A
MIVTLIDLLKQKGSDSGAGVTFIESGHHEEYLSYAGLYASALKALSFMQKRGVRRGDELVFQIADNKTFVIVFWACILGGFIPVPLSVGQTEEHRIKPFNVWQVLNTPWLIISEADFSKLGETAHAKGLEEFYACMDQHRMEGSEILASEEDGQPALVGENDIAFLQFSSGSTGQPKGVVLTHRNLLLNLRAIAYAADYSPADSTLSWMPLTHDMGLIGFHLNPLLVGMSQYLMPVNLFIRRPSLWLEKASEHKISVLSSPNFVYTYLMRNMDANRKYNWDLSHVRIIYNGAEPISERTARQFTTDLAQYGLSSNAICPVYGLAEATLAVTMTDWRSGMKHIELDRSRLKPGDKIMPAETKEGTISFVNVGKPVEECAVRITDKNHNTLSDGTVGHVLINGESVTAGYYNNITATGAATGRDGWWNTGDLGFMKEGALFITGRFKDMICVNGRNYYPHDMERTVEEAGLVDLNKFVVGGCFNGTTQKEEVIGFVFHRESLDKFVPIAQKIKALVSDKTGLELDRLIPVREIPRTTSGKLQRYKLVEQFMENRYGDTLAALEQNLSSAGKRMLSESQPANANEQRLLDLTRKVLGNDSFGVEEGFFAAGGNSLKAAALVMAVWKEFEVDLSMDTVYEKQTVRALAQVIGLLSPQEYVPLIPEDGSELENNPWLPLAAAQKRLYYQWQIDKSSVSYNIPLAFYVEGHIEADRLESCIRQLIQRHEVLRTSFRTDAEPMATIHARVDFSLQRITCTMVELDDVITAFVLPFDLATPPSLRAALVQADTETQLLLLDFHHIVSDGLSVNIFFKELLNLYDGKQLPLLPAQYKHFVAWEIGNHSSKKLRMQERYWRSKLAGELPSLQMPLDFQRPVLFSTEGKKLQFSLGAARTERLKAFARSNNCTLQVLLQTIYKVLLSKYTGQDDLIVGVPVAGRTHPDLQNVQGMFVNNLATRTEIKGSESFLSLLHREKNNFSENLENQEYPFDQLMSWIAQEHDSSRNRVFDTMFVYQDARPGDLRSESFLLSRHYFDPGISKYDISMEIVDEGDLIRYAIEYATRLFKEETILQLAAHFERLVSAILQDRHMPVADLPMLSEKEYDDAIRGYNSTQRTYPSDSTVCRLFEVQAARCPSSIAVEYKQELLTYRQLNEKAELLADGLMAKGIGPGTVVGLLLPRSAELVVAVLGILKAGACFLPVDTDLPAERIKYILTDSRCHSVMAVHSLIPLVTGMTDGDGHPLFSVLESDGRPANHGRVAPRGLTPYDATGRLAYIIYTSGTTGLPKGVMVGHRSLVNYITWAAAVYNDNSAADYPLYTSISFDLTITSLFTPLITGGRIVVYDGAGDELLIEKVIADNKADIVKATPSHLKLILSSSSLSSDPGSRIKKFIVGGEELDSRLADAVYCKFGGKTAICNEYGPTEATVGCMIHHYHPNEDLPSVPIGIPAANTRIYLLDKNLRPVAAGVSGEMYVAGDGLALGYVGNAVLTESRFLSDPFARGEKMYKTGDLAKRLPGGIILYGGRSDRQIKINGYRIEPAEIENQMLSHPSVKEAVVHIRTDNHQKKNIYLYYTLKDGQKEVPTEGELRTFLADRLPYYMIPVRFAALDRIPLNTNGKVDHAALPTPEDGPVLPIMGPKNHIEAISLQVWEDILGKSGLSVTDNFFELGGDSIKAVQIVSALGAKGIVVSVKDLLTFHTIEQISAKATTTAEIPLYEQGPLEGRRDPLPIESWFFSQQWAQPGYFNQSILLRLHKKLHRRLLETALEMLVRHHDGLRLNYDKVSGRLFYNPAHLETKFVIEENTTGRLPGGHGLFFREEQDNFDLGTDLLIKACLYQEADEWLLLITAHHLVIDGMSWRILLEDLYNICQALDKDQPVSLPRKTAGVGMFGTALTAGSDVLRKQESYWKDIDQSVCRIPVDYITSQWNAGMSRRITGGLTKEDTGILLREAPQKYGADTITLLCSALVLALKEWTGLDQFVIEQENFGRQGLPVDVSRTIGWFTAMYPVRLEISHESPFRLVSAIKEQLSTVPDHGLGYGVLRYGSKDLSKTRSRLSGIRFNYLGQFGREFNNDLFSFDHRLTGLHMHPDNSLTAKLECNAMIVGGEMIIEFGYNSKAHKASTIHRLKTSFLEQLGRLLHHKPDESAFLAASSDFNTAGLNDADLEALFE